MTQRWGFDLSMSAVRLMRRDAGHWREIAAEPIEGADIEARLQALADQVEPGSGVDIFLPRDQILYTDVKVTDADSASREIEAAMEGRTPYALSELEIDWVIDADNTARVAAVARETLDEAEIFASGRGLSVNRFSSLAEDEDFPRQPDFGMGQSALADPDATATQAEPAFVTTRQAAPGATSVRSETPAPPPLEDAPVVHVDDAEPVMQVVAEKAPPLDPGPALPRTAGAPRVRTDLALTEGGGDVAASLAPGRAEKYGRDPVPSTTRLRVLGYGVAAVLTLGIGAIIWSILPAPDRETGEARPEFAEPLPPSVAAPAPETDTAELNDTPPDVPEWSAGFGTIPDVGPVPSEPGPFAPRPDFADIAALVPPLSDTAAALPELAPETARPLLSAAAPLAPDLPLPSEPALISALQDAPRTFPGSVALPTPAALSPDQPITAETPPVAPAAPAVAESDTAADPQSEAESVAALPQTPDLPQTEEGTDVAGAETEPAAEAGPAVASETDEAVAEAAPEEDAVSPAPTDLAEAPDPVAETPPDADAASLLPRPTELAASVPEIRPGSRPTDLRQEIERQRFGGRTVAELSRIRPGVRPESAQSVAVTERGNDAPSALAVETALAPRDRPSNIEAIVAATRERARAAELAALETPDTSAAVRAALADTDLEPEDDATSARNSPRLAIPSDASVARRATLEEAIRLNNINLVGVYGLPSDRRALIRLPSGSYVKVKVGDRIDGGTVAAIGDSVLQYRKGGRTIQLSMPQG